MCEVAPARPSVAAGSPAGRPSATARDQVTLGDRKFPEGIQNAPEIPASCSGESARGGAGQRFGDTGGERLEQADQRSVCQAEITVRGRLSSSGGHASRFIRSS